MMFCGKCGYKNEIESEYCDSCGAKTEFVYEAQPRLVSAANLNVLAKMI